MSDEKTDRRAQRTRQLLVASLMTLLEERDFNKITIQDITDQANLGRTTFYAHFESKEDLFLSGHQTLFHQLAADVFDQDGNLNPIPSPTLIWFLTQMAENRTMHFFIMGIEHQSTLLSKIIEDIANHLEKQLQTYADETTSTIPFPVLAHYLAGAMMTLINWWIVKRIPQSPQDIAGILHRLRYATLVDALGRS